MLFKILFTVLLKKVRIVKKKKKFNKELTMTKKDNEHFENSTKCWICDNDNHYGDVKVRDHCHIIRNYGSSA